MDKASDYESGDSRFESWQGRFFCRYLIVFLFFFLSFFPFMYLVFYRQCAIKISKPIKKNKTMFFLLFSILSIAVIVQWVLAEAYA